MRAVILALVLLLSSCSVWDFIKPSSGISVDTEIVAGNKQEEINTEVVGNKETTNNTADAITQTYNTINESMDWWIWVLMVIGWMTPTPTKMWGAFINLFRRKNNAKERAIQK